MGIMDSFPPTVVLSAATGLVAGFVLAILLARSKIAFLFKVTEHKEKKGKVRTRQVSFRMSPAVRRDSFRRQIEARDAIMGIKEGKTVDTEEAPSVTQGADRPNTGP